MPTNPTYSLKLCKTCIHHTEGACHQPGEPRSLKYMRGKSGDCGPKAELHARERPSTHCANCKHPLWGVGCCHCTNSKPHTLGEQVRDAQKAVQSLSPEQRATVRLEGRCINRSRS